MKQLNLVDFETRWGYRTLELYCGDLTKIDRDVDVLAVSSFAGDYTPSERTLIGALQEKCNISVLELSERFEYDFRDSLSCWIAKVNRPSRFERIVCVEISGGKLEVDEIIENLFVVLSILEMKGVNVRNLALPVLGAGNQALDPEDMIKALLSSVQKHRDHFRNLRQILFVEIDKERASRLDRGMNEQLGRIKLVLPKGQLFDALRKEISPSLDAAEALAEGRAGTLFNDLRRLVNSDESRWFEIGTTSRKLVEFMIKTILPRKKITGLLEENIGRLSDHQIAGWITSYMHVLRIFGNESVHQRETNRHPPTIDPTDILLCLYCVQRLLDFWVQFERSKRAKAR
jgi:hypothetical protein